MAVLLISMLLPARLSAVEYYVAVGGSDGNSGTNWASAFATITNALAQVDVTIITVSNGTYNTGAEIFVNKAVTVISYGDGVYGGLANATNTVVDRNGGSRVFNVSDSGVVFDGITITGGSQKVRDGKGIYMTGGAVLNCILRENLGQVRTRMATQWVAGSTGAPWRTALWSET